MKRYRKVSWLCLNNLYFLKFSKYIYIYVLMLFVGFFLSKKHKKFKKGFSSESIPVWLGGDLEKKFRRGNGIIVCKVQLRFRSQDLFCFSKTQSVPRLGIGWLVRLHNERMVMAKPVTTVLYICLAASWLSSCFSPLDPVSLTLYCSMSQCSRLVGPPTFDYTHWMFLLAGENVPWPAWLRREAVSIMFHRRFRRCPLIRQLTS